MKHATAILAAILFSALLAACSDDDSGAQPVASAGVGSNLVSVTPGIPLRAATGTGVPAGDAAVTTLPYNATSSTFSYSYDVTTGSLQVTHANAALRAAGNSASAPVSVRVRIEENIITVIERQPAQADGALALHDISFEITNLPVRAYRVVVIEPWVEKTQRPLSFRMDLVESLSGTSSAERSQSPWGDIASL